MKKLGNIIEHDLMIGDLMVKITFLIGTGYYGEDVLHKTPWARYLNKSHDLYVVSRIKPEIHLNKFLDKIIGHEGTVNIRNSLVELMNLVKDFFIVYDSQYLQKEYTKNEINELEQWLNIPFNYLSSFDRRFYDKNNSCDSRNKMELNNYLAGLLLLFREFFKKNNVKVFINTLEDDVFSVMAYFVAKRLGLKIIGFTPGRFPKKGMMFCEDFSELCDFRMSDSDLKKIKSMYNVSTIANKETLDRTSDYLGIKSFLTRYKSLECVKDNKDYRKNVISYYNYEKFIIPPISVFKEFNLYFKKFCRRYLLRSILKKPDYDNSYFLFPLHYTEDAQITFREPILDQFRLINDISRSLPLNCYLYVKPHPHYLGSDVSFKKLFRISKLENVKIINPTYPPIKLITNSQGVITVNSTTGFEALIMGVPVITLGHDFYCKDDLCYTIKDKKNLAEAIMKILCNDYSIDRKTVESFIKKVYSNTVWIDGINYNYGKFRPFGLTEVDGKHIASALDLIMNCGA
jgi:capsule polysaccharide modification protein KpsS